jgi:hypothetical protein
VRSKEAAGPRWDTTFRRGIVETLKKESIEQLELRVANSDLAIETTALGDTRADLVYTTFQQPCRIIDTRLMQEGPLAPFEVRSFQVAGTEEFELQGGTSNGCGIPLGATVAMINFVAVSPGGPGNLKGAAYPNAMPGTGSILNYQALSPTLNIANGLLFPICDVLLDTCTLHISLQANGAGTHVVADVLGYAMRFPKETIRSKAVEGFTASSFQEITSTCANYTGANVSVTAPPGVPGHVWVRATVQMYVNHGAPTATNGTIYEVYLAESPLYCFGSPGQTMVSVDTKSLKRRGRGISSVSSYLLMDQILSIDPGGTLNLTLNSQSFGNDPATEANDHGNISGARIIALFVPD